MTLKIPSILQNNILWKSVPLRLILFILFSGITIRLIPYLIPIRSEDIQQKQLAVEFSDRSNLPLGTLLSQDQNQTAIVPLKDISPVFIQAIIAAEDKRYYHHGALDTIAISRALLEALQAGEIVSGASTITMQFGIPRLVLVSTICLLALPTPFFRKLHPRSFHFHSIVCHQTPLSAKENHRRFCSNSL